MKNNNFKRFTLVAYVVAAVSFASFCTAQTNHIRRLIDLFKMDPSVFKDVQFTIALSNQALRIGSTNFLQWTLQNNSTNTALYEALGATYPSVPSPVYLTNNAHNYLLIDVPRPPKSPNLSSPPGAIFFPSIDAGKTAEWKIEFVVSNDIAVGDYKVVANQFVTNTNREGCVLTSTLDVKVEQ